MSSREQEIAKIANMYSRYLNGPLGRGVMDHLKEGESFTIKSQFEVLEIMKLNGKAVVRVIEQPTANAANDSGSLSNFQEF
ncbi:MAG: hypothetical protein ACFFCX_11980 [Candidatus Sifarchaeia archaeon]